MGIKTLPDILVTNDDGVHSPGLLAAISAIKGLAKVTVIAPLKQQTGMGRAQSGNPKTKIERKTLYLDGVEYEAFACDASPARSLGHGLQVFKDYKPDLVVSGINYGENLGASVTASGTVGAAIEGACRGIPGIAVSLETPVENHFSYASIDWNAAIHFLRHFVQLSLTKGLPKGVDILKIDVPNSATIHTPWKVTRLSQSRYYKYILPNPSLDSLIGDAIPTINVNATEQQGTDVHALAIEKVVSVTPLTIDLTAHETLEHFKDWA